MEAKQTKSRKTLLILVAVFGAGVLMFILLLVIPAIFFLSKEEQSGFQPRAVYGRDTEEITIPSGDGSAAPDFFDDLSD